MGSRVLLSCGIRLVEGEYIGKKDARNKWEVRYQVSPKGCWLTKRPRQRVMIEGVTYQVYVLVAMDSGDWVSGCHVHHKCSEDRCIFREHLVPLTVRHHGEVHRGET